jgi:uncharacterized phage infection (PIP) family protein YhgE
MAKHARPKGCKVRGKKYKKSLKPRKKIKTDIAAEIAKSVKIIRRKYSDLMRNKLEMKQNILANFAPLTKPLELGISNVANNLKDIISRKDAKLKQLEEERNRSRRDSGSDYENGEMRNEGEQHSHETNGDDTEKKEEDTNESGDREQGQNENNDQDYSDENDDDDDDDEKSPPSPMKELAKLHGTSEASKNIKQLLDQLDPELRPYIERVYSGRTTQIDQIYGVRLSGRYWLLGSEIIDFRDGNVFVNDKYYKGSKGLYELLFASNPKNSIYNKNDLDTYKKILVETNAHRRTYSSHKPINANRSAKYANIIGPLFPAKSRKSTGFGLIDALKPTYHYYSDINEIVDRLRLLHASRAAGNDSHSNEINSIESEMRELRIIQ